MINQWQDYGDLDCGTGPICVAANGEAVLTTNGIDPEASAWGTTCWTCHGLVMGWEESIHLVVSSGGMLVASAFELIRC